MTARAFAMVVLAFLAQGCELTARVDVDAGDEEPSCPDEPGAYEAVLETVPAGSAPAGSAWITLTEQQDLVLEVDAEQLVQNNFARVVVLGFADGGDARCPTLEQDAATLPGGVGDGLITLGEAEGVAGGVILEAGTAPTDESGTLAFDTTADAAGTCPLTRRLVALVMSPFGAPPDLVVRCGEVRALEPNEAE